MENEQSEFKFKLGGTAVLCPIMSTISICKIFSPVKPGFQSQNSFFIGKIALFLGFFW